MNQNRHWRAAAAVTSAILSTASLPALSGCEARDPAFERERAAKSIVFADEILKQLEEDFAILKPESGATVDERLQAFGRINSNSSDLTVYARRLLESGAYLAQEEQGR